MRFAVAAAALFAAGCAPPVVRHARRGELPKLQAALQAGRIKPKDLGAALCEAAARGQEGAARLLLENGAPVEAGLWTIAGHRHGCVNQGGNPCAKGLKPPPQAGKFKGPGYIGMPTPLGCAAYYGHAELVELLLPSGASVNGESTHFNRIRQQASPLVLAAVNGDARIVRLLLAARADPFYVTTTSGFLGRNATAHEWAVELGHHEAASVLKAEMDSRAPSGSVPVAARGGGKLGFLRQVTALAGGFVPGLSQVSDALGKVNTAVTVAQAGTAVYQASRPVPPLAAPAVAEPPPAPPAPEPKLHEVAHAGDAGKIALALAGGAPVDEVCAEGATALMHAAAMGHHEAVKALLRAKAAVDAGNADGVTALMAAAVTNRREAVAALLAAGADPNLKAKSGGTALSLAAAAGHKEIMAALTKAGAR